MNFKIGDYVQLRDTHGPCMTVIGAAHSRRLMCCWFDGHELQEAIVLNDSLVTCEDLDANAKVLQGILSFNEL